MRSASRWFKHLILVVAVLGLLTAAGPSAAQGSQPPIKSDQRIFLENRLQDPGQYQPLIQSAPGQPDRIDSLYSWPITDFGTQGSYPSIDVDTYGRPHIVANSFYAHFDGRFWQTETITGGDYTSLALDSSNQPHYTYAAAGLHYAYRDVLGWHVETIAAVGSQSQLVIGNDDNPQVAFIDGGLKYGYRDGAGWHIQSVAASASEVALAVDTARRPHMLYVGDGALRYAFQDGAGWHVQTIPNAENYPSQPSIAVDSHNRPHISYCAWCQFYYGGEPHLKYGRYTGSAWQLESIPPAYGEGLINTITLDAADQPRIAYQAWDTFNYLTYAQKTAAGWKFQRLDYIYFPQYGGVPGPHLSMALDAAGRPHIAYYQSSWGAMGELGALRYTYQQTDLSAWSRLAFSSYRDQNWEIYTANADGSNQTRRTDRSSVESVPKLNRGANRLAFASNRDLNYEIYAANFDGTGVTRLTNNAADDYWPNWSPDSQFLAFQSTRDGNVEIYVMTATGTGVTRLTNNAAWDGQPAWSPDGTQLVFVSNRGGAYDLWAMQRDGSNLHQLTFNLDAAYPAWSPDGTQIAFSNDHNGDTWLDLSTINADGTNLIHRRYGGSNTDNIGPGWSPSGQDITFANVHWILYQGQYYWDSANIYHLALATSTAQAVTNSGVDWWPAWASTDTIPPVSTIDPLPTYSPGNFAVQWIGFDYFGSANLMSFDILYRDGAAGDWTMWLTATTQYTATFTGQNGHWYCFQSRARDFANNLEAMITGTSDACTTVDTTPPTASAASPAQASAPAFMVTWTGSDAASGLASYDVQYRDGELGTWTDWMLATTRTSLQFNGELNHTYYFRARARDHMGNEGAFTADGDTHTVTPLYAVSGAVKGNRDQVIAWASVQTTPAALNQPKTDHLGNFALYFNLSGTLSLTATRSIFGSLPPMPNVLVAETSSNPIIYLPPLDDQLSDGHFESGTLSAWNPIGLLTPTITTTAHTGEYAALLGGIVASDTISGGPYLSTIEQTITVPVTLTDGTLSLLYQVTAADPLSDTLTAYLIGSTDTLTFTLPVTATAWTHHWFNVSAWNAPTATLRIELATPDQERAVGVLIDEVTWGSFIIGSRPIYLPVMHR